MDGVVDEFAVKIEPGCQEASLAAVWRRRASPGAKITPHGFVAKPETRLDGFVDMMDWHCTIPERKGYIHGVYPNCSSKEEGAFLRRGALVQAFLNKYALSLSGQTDWEDGYSLLTLISS